MGTLRLLLALFVILEHMPYLGFHLGTGGSTAVQCFYILSGFFMALILNEKYNQPGQLGLFYSNRFLRLFSVYWLFLLLNVALSLVNLLHGHTGTMARLIDAWPRLGGWGGAAVMFGNVFLVGHDWTAFLELGRHGLAWPVDARHPSQFLSSLYFVPQSWTLGVEVTFYLIAPFLVRRRLWVLIVMVLATLGVRYALASNGFDWACWFNGFFPSELGMFLLGAIAYRGYARYKQRLKTGPWVWLGVLPLVLAVGFPLLRSNPYLFFNPGHSVLYAGFVLGIPALFVATGRLGWDRAVGELSYPVYLCHEMFIQILGRVSALAAHPAAMTLAVMVLSCGLAWLVVRYLDEPVNRFREMRVRRAQAGPQDERD